MSASGLQQVYPVLNRNTRIRQNADGYYLSSQLHRRKVQIDSRQAELLSQLDGRRTLAEVLSSFPGEDQKRLLSAVLKLNEMFYLDCFGAPATPPRDMAPQLPTKPAPHLQEVHLDLTAECNLRCRHCYQLNYIGNHLPGTQLTAEEWLSVLDQIRDLNVDRVNISGGEPLTFNDLPRIVSGIYERGIKLSSVFTNGVLPLDGFMEFMDQFPYPLDFSVSVDGPDRETHEHIRGRGTYDATMRSVALLADRAKNDTLARYSFDVNTCVFNSNVDRLEEMYEVMQARGVQRWRLSLPRDEGAFMRNRHLEAERPRAFDAYRRLLERYLADYDTRGPDGVMYLQIESIFRTSMLLRGEVATFGPDASCCEYKRYGLAIKPNGDVLSCTSFQSKVMGNLRERSLQDIWYDERSQQLKKLPISEVTDCQDCRLLQYCGTGCRSNVFDRTGTLSAKDELACAIYEFFDAEVRPMLDRYGVRYVS